MLIITKLEYSTGLCLQKLRVDIQYVLLKEKDMLHFQQGDACFHHAVVADGTCKKWKKRHSLNTLLENSLHYFLNHKLII